MRKPKRLTAKQIRAARLAISRAESDAQSGGEWDEERSAELELGWQVLERLLKDAISKAEGRSE